jgi:hypothetical protein
MALTKVINDLADLNQSDSTNALKGCAGTTAEQPASSSSIEYIIVGGGGGGATNGSATGDGLGGGGAGGYVIGTGVDATTVYHGTPTVLTVGDGGNGGTTTNGYDGINGNDSGFNGIRAIGGGGGGAGTAFGIDGGSGGGGGRNGGAGGSSLNSQGNDGGTGGTGSTYYNSTGAGGGGSGEPFLDTNGTGSNGANTPSGAGGSGGSGTDITSFISVANANLAQIGDTSNTTQVFVAGGGGGGAYSGTKGTGGSGGGGTGGQSGTNATNGIDNTGGGGGGDGSALALGADGGSGVAVLKYDNTIVTGYTLNSEDTYTVNWPADKYGAVYYPLNLDVKDVGGYYDGTATDITYTNGQFNQAASFNGSSSYITLPNSVEVYKGTGKFAISAWFKTDTIPGTEQMLYCTFETAYLFIKLKASGVIEGQVAEASTGTGRVCETPTGTISTDVWYHVVFTGDTNDLRLYIDGTLSDSESTWNGTFYTSSAGCSIGSRNVGTNQFWDGEIEQVRIYSGPLTTSDVQDIYNNSKPGSLPPLKTSSDLTTTKCNYPSGVTGLALYQLDNVNETCGTWSNATNVGSATFTPGKFGDALTLNGSSQYLTLSDTWTYSNNFSCSVWVYIHDFTPGSTSYPMVLGFWGSGSYAWFIELDASGTPEFNAYMYGPALRVGSTSTLALNTWYHIAFTTSSTDGKKFYLNGVLEEHNADTQDATTTTPNANFIGQSTWGSDYFDGQIDQLRFYNSVLTDQNIYDLWQKENNIQTYFPDTPTSGTDTLVFKSGSGEITFKNDTPPGAEIGMLRYNSTLGQMEHFNSGGWKDFTNCTTYLCNYPTTATALYQFNSNATDTCGNYNGTNDSGIIYGPPGKFGNCAQFGGGADRIDIDQALLGSGTTKIWSTSFWFLTSSTAEQYMNNTGAASAHSGFGIFINPTNGYLRYQTSSGSSFSPYLSLEDRSVQDGNWHHVVATYSSAGGTNDAYMYLYLDGVNVTSLCTPKNSWTQGGGATWSSFTIPRISLGNWADSSSYPTGLYPLIGSMDQLRFFNTALTQTQVTKLYNEVYCP